MEFSPINEVKVAIILITYNSMKYLDNLFKDLKNIKYSPKDLMLFVIDNSSSDDTYNFLRKNISSLGWWKVILHRNSSNLGFAGATSIALSIIYKYFPDIKYIIIINPDIKIIDPCFIKKLVSFANKIKRPVILGCSSLGGHDHLRMDSFGGILDPLLVPAEEFPAPLTTLELLKELPIYKGDVYYVPYVSFNCVLIPRATIERVGFLLGNLFMYFDDTEYCLRAWTNNIPSIIYKDPLIWHARGYSKYVNNVNRVELGIKDIKDYREIDFYYIFNSLRITAMYGDPFRIIAKTLIYVIYAIINKTKRKAILLSLAYCFFKRVCRKSHSMFYRVPRGLILPLAYLRGYYIFWFMKYILKYGIKRINEAYKYASIRLVMEYLKRTFKVKNKAM